MRLVQPLLLTLGFLASYVVAEDASAEIHKVKHDYQVCCIIEKIVK